MDYLLTDEQKMVKDLAHKIAEEKIRPVAAKYDQSEEYPWDIIKVIAEAGLFGLFIPEEYGGMAVNLLNVEKIVIGGGVAEAGALVFDPIRETIKQRAMKLPAKTVKVVKAKLGYDSGVIGAASLVLHEKKI